MTGPTGPAATGGPADTIGTASGEPTADRHWRLRHLPVLLAASAVLIDVAAAVGGLTRGGVGAAGAAVGVGIVVFSYTLTTVMLAWADATNPQLVLPFGLVLYATKFTLFGVVMAAVSARGWPGLVPLAFGVCVGVLVWTGTHIVWLVRVHVPRSRRDPAD